MNKMIGLLVASGFALGGITSASAQSPHDEGGVGAQGLIGRGTIPEERPAVSEPAPVESAPVYLAAPVAAPVATPMAAPDRPAAVTMTSARVPGPAAPVRQPARARVNPYVWYDRSWLHGYWTATVAATTMPTDGSPARSSAPGRDGVSRGPTPGRGLGWGLPAWLSGPMIYRWGYLPYRNPFLEEGTEGKDRREPVLDDSRPVDITAPPPGEAVLYDGLRAFGEARAAFRREDYMLALRRVDEAMKLIPYAPSLHLFRGFTLLALHRYRDAAIALHASLAVVPGWDWTTMARLYHNIATYTRQLRLLETYSEENPRSAAAHFLLAVQYLTTGYTDAALIQLRQVAILLPDDHLTRRLIREIQPPADAPPATTATQSAAPGKLEGTWTASPREGTSITATFGPRGHVAWKVSERGQVRRFEGFGLHFDGVLTVSENPDNSLSGRIIWSDADHFTFKLLDERPGDAGLAFARSS